MPDHVFFTGDVTGALCALFLAVTFIQSGLDKVFDYRGNLSYLQSVFEKTFLRSAVAMLLPVIMLMELLSGFVCLAGAPLAILSNSGFLCSTGLALSALTLIFLLLGQRVAKDYAGAASLTGYFLVAVAGIIGLAMQPDFC